jgi:glycosyltransferase involved in cell wall biosynthesis
LNRVTWVFPGSFDKLLDSSTWLETAEKLTDLGWQVTLAACGFPAALQNTVFERKIVYRGNRYFIDYIAYILRINRYLIWNANNQQIVCFHDPMSVLFLAISRNVLFRRYPKLLFDIRTVPMETTKLRNLIRMLYDNINMRLGFFIADGITTITERMAQYIYVPPKKFLGTWSSGVDLDLFRSAVEKRRWPNVESTLRFVYIGAIYEERNLLNFCEAIINIRKRGVQVEFSIVGDGPQRDELEVFLDKRQANCVKLLSQIPHDEIPSLLAENHIGVLPFPDWPRFRVSSPIKLFEYMASGMPILATRIPCHTDVIQNSNFVFWAEDGSVEALEEAIIKACQHYEDLRSMGEMAQVEARKWTWKIAAKKLSRSLNELNSV